MKGKIVFLFDIDGTLLLSGGAGKIATNRAFKELFNEDDVWQDIVPDGRTDHSIMSEVFRKRFNKEPTCDQKKLIQEKYTLALKEELPESKRFRLMPYVIETLNYLSNHPRVSLGLATGNYEKAAYLKLMHAGLDHHFSYGGFGSDEEDRLELTRVALGRAKESINEEPSEVYVVGDTIHDIRCGKGIGAKVIAVCTGYSSVQLLSDEDPTYLINDLSELKACLDF